MKILFSAREKSDPRIEKKRLEKQQMTSCREKCEKQALKKIRRFNKKEESRRSSP
jgi:hypothetical protein